MTAEALSTLSEKFRKQTEGGINAMLEANLDPKAELVTLIESLRRGEAADAATTEPFTLANSVLEVLDHPSRCGPAELRIAG